MTAKTVVDVILGEAEAGSYEDMLAIASVIANRATGGRTSWQDVVSRQSEFNAYDKALPSGVSNYRAMAEKAVKEVQSSGPVHNATFYATKKEQGNLPKGLKQVTSTNGHNYFTDPQQRPIYTASGLKPIDYASFASGEPNTALGYVPRPATRPSREPFNAVLTEKPQGLAVLNPSGGALSFNHPWQEAGLRGVVKDGISGAGLELGRDIQVTSGHRPRKYNRSIGSGDGSLHIPGKAADISMSGMDAETRQSLVQNLTQRGAGGFITYDSSPDMLHVDWRNRSSEFRPHFMHNKSSRNMGSAPEWFKEMDRNDGVLLPKRDIPVPSSRRNTFAAPFGKDERGGNLAPASKQYSGRGGASTPIPVSSPAIQGTAPTSSLPIAPQGYSADAYKNYGMNARTVPEVASNNVGLPTNGPVVEPQNPNVIGAPLDIIPSVPIPAPRPTRVDRFKQKAGEHLRKQFDPKTIAARAVGGMVAGPIGAVLGPKIAQFANRRINNGQGFNFGMRPQEQGQQSGGYRWGNQAVGNPITYGNGNTSQQLSNGQEHKYNAKTGKSYFTSIPDDFGQRADLKSFFSGFSGNRKDK